MDLPQWCLCWENLLSDLRVLSVLLDAEVSYFAVRHQHLYREGKYHLG